MATKYLFFSLFAFLFFLSKCNSINVDGENNREGKVFSLFSIVNFENTECESTVTSTSGQNRNGTCFTTSECGDKGGSSKGSCASGFGVCCVFIINDATTTSITQNDTYIQNPGYPTTYAETNSLSYTVSKCSDKVCFLRLDFEDMTITGPANSLEYDYTGTESPAITFADTLVSGGKCYLDYLEIKPATSSGQTVPQICGKNTGQHVYIGMGSSGTDTASIAFTFSGTSSSRKWDIKVAQIECGINAPPDGCLQYYTGLAGQIQTFNFLDGTTTHLALQEYNICMRKEQGYCCIQYQACDETLYPGAFSLYRDAYDNAATSLGSTSCTQDYITIDGGTGSCSSNLPISGNSRMKFCGGRFSPQVGSNAKVNTPVCDCTSPFQVGVVTDNTADKQDSSNAGASVSRGICLDFQQQPC